MEGFEEVSTTMFDYYIGMLGTKSERREPLNQQLISRGRVLSLRQQVQLRAPFQKEEIKKVLFTIPHFKSPGPNGFSSGFYKASWHIIGDLICNTIHEFWQTGKLSPHLSDTRIILLPKTPNPQSVSDFRPISCCNVIYKTISKLLCIRLKEVLPSIIDQSQSAFVKGRELLFNVLICHDLARGYNRKNISPGVFSKWTCKRRLTPFIGSFSKRCLKPSNFLQSSQNG